MKQLITIFLLVLSSTSMAESYWPEQLNEINSEVISLANLETLPENYKFLSFEETIKSKGVVTYKASLLDKDCGSYDNFYIQLYVSKNRIKFSNTFVTYGCP